MMEFFDYVYYKCCQFYEASDGKGAGISGLALLSVLQLINLTSILGIVFQTFHFWIDINKLWYAIPAFFLITLNGFRYNRLNYNFLKEKWKNEDVKNSNKKRTLVILYVLITVISVIAVIIWRANSK